MFKITLLLLLLTCSTAFAADATAGDVLTGFLNSTVYPVVGAFLLGLVSLLLNKLRKKYNLEISAGMQEQLEAVAKRGIAFAQEKADATIKANLTRFTGSDKLNAAITFIMDNSPGVTEQQAHDLVHSVLGMTSGVGASGETAVK